MIIPFMARVGVTPYFLNMSRKRQNPTRFPYSCQDQLGTSGKSGCPMGGGRMVQGWALVEPQCSTFIIVQTAIRAPPGVLASAGL